MNVPLIDFKPLKRYFVLRIVILNAVIAAFLPKKGKTKFIGAAFFLISAWQNGVVVIIDTMCIIYICATLFSGCRCAKSVVCVVPHFKMSICIREKTEECFVHNSLIVVIFDMEQRAVGWSIVLFARRIVFRQFGEFWESFFSVLWTRAHTILCECQW